MITPPKDESLKITKLRLPMCIPHTFCANLVKGARAQLDTQLFRSLEKDLGVLISYHDVKLEKKSACSVLTDVRSPYIYSTFLASALVFRPRVNQILVGVVSNVGLDHIGMLVHGLFNASVSAKDTTVYESDVEQQCWVSTKDNTTITVGCSVAFQVKQVKIATDFLSIIGTIKDAKKTGLVSKPVVPPASTKRKVFEDLESGSDAEADEGEPEPPRKKKKVDSIEKDETSADNMDTDDEPPKSAKKKKLEEANKDKSEEKRDKAKKATETHKQKVTDSAHKTDTKKSKKKRSDSESEKGSDKESDKESDKASDMESEKESDKESDNESVNESEKSGSSDDERAKSDSEENQSEDERSRSASEEDKSSEEDAKSANSSDEE